VTAANRGSPRALILYDLALLMAIALMCFKKKSPGTEILLFMIGFSFALTYSLRSSYVLGYDIHGEIFIANRVIQNSHWLPYTTTEINPVFRNVLGNYNSCLSITVLPCILSKVSGLDVVPIYRSVYPLFLGIFLVFSSRIIRTILRSNSAHAVSLFMLNLVFLRQMPAICRQEVALMLFVLVVFFAIRRFSLTRSQPLLILLGIGVIATHYTTGLVLIFVLALMLILDYIFSRERIVDFSTTAFFSIIAFAYFWYTGYVMQTGMIVISKMVEAFRNFILAPRSYGPLVIHSAPLAFDILRYFALYVPRALCVLGILIGLLGRFPAQASTKKPWIYIGLLSFSAASFTIIVPLISGYYNPERLDFNLLIFTLPFMVVALTKLRDLRMMLDLRKIIFLMLVCLVLVTTGWAGFFTGFTNTIRISPRHDVAEFMQDSDIRFYVSDSEMESMEWFNELGLDVMVNTDIYGSLRLWSMAHHTRTRVFKQDLKLHYIPSDRYFLREEILIYGQIPVRREGGMELIYTDTSRLIRYLDVFNLCYASDSARWYM
jgi:uncharacterized membrane protein